MDQSKKGAVIKNRIDEVETGDVILHDGSYFLTINTFDEEEINSAIGSEIIQKVDATGDLSSNVDMEGKFTMSLLGVSICISGKSFPQLVGKQIYNREFNNPKARCFYF